MRLNRLATGLLLVFSSLYTASALKRRDFSTSYYTRTVTSTSAEYGFVSSNWVSPNVTWLRNRPMQLRLVNGIWFPVLDAFSDVFVGQMQDGVLYAMAPDNPDNAIYPPFTRQYALTKGVGTQFNDDIMLYPITFEDPALAEPDQWYLYQITSFGQYGIFSSAVADNNTSGWAVCAVDPTETAALFASASPIPSPSPTPSPTYDSPADDAFWTYFYYEYSDSFDGIPHTCAFVGVGPLLPPVDAGAAQVVLKAAVAADGPPAVDSVDPLGRMVEA